LFGKIKVVVLNGNGFTCLVTNKLAFLDIESYITPGFDYASSSKLVRRSSRIFTGHTSRSKISSNWTSPPTLHHHRRRLVRSWVFENNCQRPAIAKSFFVYDHECWNFTAIFCCITLAEKSFSAFKLKRTVFTRLSMRVAESEVKYPTPDSRLRFRPIQNFRLRLLNLKGMKFGC